MNKSTVNIKPPRIIYDLLYDYESLGGKIDPLIHMWFYNETVINEKKRKESVTECICDPAYGIDDRCPKCG